MHVNPRLAALLERFNNPSLPGIDLSLERVEKLLAALGDPQKRLPLTIHVAGTNGKGSTIAFMRAMLEAAGKNVHVYSSPHLVTFNERIVLAGKMIGDDALIELLERTKKAAANIPVTFFEATTAAAFLAFSEHPADYLLIEVGLGGRLDATNLVTPIASVITPIALDHQEFLGNDIAVIAAEKAGIIKRGVPVITGRQPAEAMRVIEQTAQRLAAPLTIAKPLRFQQLGLEGDHQQENAALAVAVLRAVAPIPETAIETGSKKANWPGRLQKLTSGPFAGYWLDGGHNAHASAALAVWARTQKHPLTLVCGLMARKDAAAFFAPFVGVADKVITLTIPHASDALDAASLCETAQKAGLKAEAVASLEAATAILRRDEPATVLICGSLYLAGEILKTHE